MSPQMDISQLLANQHDWVILDVRSPGEFAEGHIPGAISFPLFSDEERARIGTLYKQTSPESAMSAGLDIAGSKMRLLTELGKEIQTQFPDRNMVIHCWRGGKRSEAVQWLFNFNGIPASRLTGGYKRYRQHIQHFFEHNPFTLRVVGGATGSGKTELLHELKLLGEQIIDLEEMACHRGSAFGAIGMPPQPKTEQFENELFHRFLHLDPQRIIWIENESKNIGRVYVPESFWHQMRHSRLYVLELDMATRLQRVVEEYTSFQDQESLAAGFEKIQKRLGGLDYQLAIKALKEHDMTTAAKIALTYYDKAYTYQLGQWSGQEVIQVKMETDMKENARALIRLDKIHSSTG